MFLPKATFATVIDSAPLVSLDLVVVDTSGNALFGQRLNRPAKGYWFVPGGRILKNESLKDAFHRLTQEELGQAFNMEDAQLIGPYDHFYEDYVFTDDNPLPHPVSTHYVAIAYLVKLKDELTDLPLAKQHDGYQWLALDEITNNTDVHKHSQWYFENESVKRAMVREEEE